MATGEGLSGKSSCNQEIGGGLAGAVLRMEKFLGVCSGNKDLLLLDHGWLMVTWCCNLVACMGGGSHSGSY